MPATLSLAVDRLVDETEAADFLSIKPQTLAVWRSSKRYALAYQKIGRCVRYKLSALQRFVDENTVGGTDE